MNPSDMSLPPVVPPITSRSTEYPLGEDPSDREPISGVTGLIEAVLRHPRRVIYQLKEGMPGHLILPLILTAVILIGIYGLIVGSFSGGEQWFAAPIKIAAGMVVTAVICVPSLYIFASLSGSSARLHEISGALGGLLALMTLLLIGFAPVAWLFSQSTESAAMMGFLHLVFFLVSMHFGMRFLMSAFRHFGIRSYAGLNVWAAIFLLVSLQMTAALRPLIGTADTVLPQEKKFFVAHWFDSMNSSKPEDHTRRSR